MDTVHAEVEFKHHPAILAFSALATARPKTFGLSTAESLTMDPTVVQMTVNHTAVRRVPQEGRCLKYIHAGGRGHPNNELSCLWAIPV
jgi:hypothetical protein